MRRRYKILFILIGIFALLECGAIAYISLTRTYEIKSLTNTGNKYTLNFDKVNNSVHYVVKVKENNNTIIEKEIEDNTFNFELDNTDYESTYEVSVVAVKKNGEERIAHGTLNVNIMGEENEPKGNDKTLSDDVIRYYDLDSDGWRSFIIENLKEWKID